MPSCPVGSRERGRTVGMRLSIVGGLERLEEREESVTCFETNGTLWGCVEALQGGLFHGEVGFNVAVSGRGVLVTEPQGNRGDVDAGLEQMHRRGVTTMPHPA